MTKQFFEKLFYYFAMTVFWLIVVALFAGLFWLDKIRFVL